MDSNFSFPISGFEEEDGIEGDEEEEDASLQVSSLSSSGSSNPRSGQNFVEFRAIHDFVAEDEFELTIECGERILGIGEWDHNWWLVKSLQTGDDGLVPRNTLIEAEIYEKEKEGLDDDEDFFSVFRRSKPNRPTPPLPQREEVPGWFRDMDWPSRISTMSRMSVESRKTGTTEMSNLKVPAWMQQFDFTSNWKISELENEVRAINAQATKRDVPKRKKISKKGRLSAIKFVAKLLGFKGKQEESYISTYLSV